MSSLILTFRSSVLPPALSSHIDKCSPWHNLLYSLFSTYDRISLSTVYIATNISDPSIVQLNIPLQATPSSPNPAPLLPVIGPQISLLLDSSTSISIATHHINTPLHPIACLPVPRTALAPYTEFVSLRRPADTIQTNVGWLQQRLDEGAEIIAGSLGTEERENKPVQWRSGAFGPLLRTDDGAEGGSGEKGKPEESSERVWAGYVEWKSAEARAELMRIQTSRGLSWDGMLEGWAAETSFWKVREVRRQELDFAEKGFRRVLRKLKMMLR